MKGVVSRLDIPLVFEVKVGRHLLKILHFLNTRKMRQNLLNLIQYSVNSIGNIYCVQTLVRTPRFFCKSARV
jgi:hypothetical protein